MEPIVVVTAILGAMYIVGRGGLLLAPTETVAFYRRMYSTTKGMRIGAAVLGFIAPALIITARQARATHGEITDVIQIIGWIAAVAAVWVIAAPSLWQRLFEKTLYSASKPTLRAIGVLNLAVGLFFLWVAFFVL